MLGACPPYQTAAARPSRLDDLPYLAVTCLAEWVIRLDSNRTACLLALAAPTLYAPCLRIAIQMGNDFRPGELFTDFSDTTHNKHVGAFVVSKYQLDRVHLLLPPRDGDRTLLSSDVATNKDPPSMYSAVMSRKWSRLYVPIMQLRCFSTKLFEDYAIPPMCYRLALVDCKQFPWTIVVLPMTLVELELDDTVLPSSDAEMQLIKIPLNLRKFTLKQLARRYGNNAAASKAYGLAVSRLLSLLPATITTLAFERQFQPFPRQALRAIYELIMRLPSLTSFTMAGEVASDFKRVFRALPRDKLLLLDLRLDFCYNMLTKWSVLLEKLPISVGTLRFCVMCRTRRAYAALRVVPLLRLPLATEEMSVRLPNWSETMCEQLPLSPTLRKLSLGVMRWEGTRPSLDTIAPRLPASLTRVELNL